MLGVCGSWLGSEASVAVVLQALEQPMELSYRALPSSTGLHWCQAAGAEISLWKDCLWKVALWLTQSLVLCAGHQSWLESEVSAAPCFFHAPISRFWRMLERLCFKWMERYQEEVLLVLSQI